MYIAKSLSVSAAAVLAVFGMSMGPVLAQGAIGGTVVVKNDVSSQKSGNRSFLKLSQGAHVFQDDLVRTRKNSLAKIVFLDKTNMSVGPESEAKLDKFVYNGDGTAKDVVIDATKGAFRFFSGKSASKAYRVITPQAVIGVRGTTYDVRITNGQTHVVLQDGEVNVCVRNTANCRVLNQPGQSLNVDDTGITDPIPPANKTWDFASHCTGAASTLCAKTTQFALAPLPAPKAAPTKIQKPRAKPRRKAKRSRARPPRQRNIRPRRPGRRIVRRPRDGYRGGYVDEPIYDPPPRRGVIIEEPRYRPPFRCYPGSRHPRCRTVRPRPRPCYGVYRRGRCVSRPIVRPRPPSHGRPIYRPRPPSHGRPIYRPRQPSFGRPSRRPSEGRQPRQTRRPNFHAQPRQRVQPRQRARPNYQRFKNRGARRRGPTTY